MIVPVQSLSPSMNSRDQTGPSTPFNQAPHSASMLQSPAYPSPAGSDTEPARYPVDGPGLYQYSQPFPTSADRFVFSSSSRPSQDWNGTPSMPAAPIVNPWTSGAYDHPVCPDNRSNMLWPEYHSTHRSSTSSHRAMSVFSGDGSEHSFPTIKMEGSASWAPDNEFSATVAPARLTNPTPYEGAYGSPMSPYESDSTSGSSYKAEFTGQASPGSRRPKSSQSDSKISQARKHSRRTKVPDAEAKFRCDICGCGFVRAYNKKTHMMRHEPNRQRDHRCTYDDCENKFERKTDLQRHINSVHLHEKPHKCELCGKRFARKDTLNRHDVQGGCPRRNEIDVPTLIARSRSMQSSPALPQSYLPSPQPEMYASFHPADHPQGLFGSRHQQGADGGVFDGRYSRFSNAGFGHSPHGL
ncbi:hypothetical protein PMIN04_010583 [Paraphaeosphaeria minitans]